MQAKVRTVSFQGIDVVPVDVQVLVAPVAFVYFFEKRGSSRSHSEVHPFELGKMFVVDLLVDVPAAQTIFPRFCHEPIDGFYFADHLSILREVGHNDRKREIFDVARQMLVHEEHERICNVRVSANAVISYLNDDTVQASELFGFCKPRIPR